MLHKAIPSNKTTWKIPSNQKGEIIFSNLVVKVVKGGKKEEKEVSD